jgi:nucleoside recognition membrane protein YjiH
MYRFISSIIKALIFIILVICFPIMAIVTIPFNENFSDYKKDLYHFYKDLFDIILD